MLGLKMLSTFYAFTSSFGRLASSATMTLLVQTYPILWNRQRARSANRWKNLGQRQREADYVRIAAVISFVAFCAFHAVAALWRLDIGISSTLRGSRWLTRIVLVRGIGALYFSHFWQPRCKVGAIFGIFGTAADRLAQI